MRHKQLSHSFGRRGGPRKALLKGLVISLVEHERIQTTLTKAKELKRHVERAITIGQKGDIGTRRLLTARYGCDKTTAKIVGDISPRFKARPGGYTRILKLNPRPGDNAPMALIEFVDYKLPSADSASENTVKSGVVEKAKASKLEKAKAAKRKNVRKMKSESRKRNRA